jgi:transcriptional regulator with XRE-family HTH domain
MTESRVDPERFARAVANVIEELRWEKRIPSKRQLAERAGMTHTYLNKRLDGGQPFDVEDLAKVANAFGVGPEDIIEKALQVDYVWTGVEIEASAVTKLLTVAEAREAKRDEMSKPAQKAARKTDGKR